MECELRKRQHTDDPSLSLQHKCIICEFRSIVGIVALKNDIGISTKHLKWKFISPSTRIIWKHALFIYAFSEFLLT